MKKYQILTYLEECKKNEVLILNNNKEEKEEAGLGRCLEELLGDCKREK